jgi:ubiquinone/menaquinone biosynthesis C-methylase UbiE
MAPNHHAHHPAFAGVSGLLAALSMLVGRTSTARLAADLADLRDGDVVVDLGCGPGVAARLAARRGATVVGVDPATVMLSVARRVPGGRNVEWREGTAEETGLGTGAATVIWSLATVHHWNDLDRGLDEVTRVLRDGGRFVAVEREVRPGATGHATHGWTSEQAVDFAEDLRRHVLTDVAVAHHDGVRGRSISVVGRKPPPQP